MRKEAEPGPGPASSKSFGARRAPSSASDGTATPSLGYLGDGIRRTGREPRHIILSIIPRMRALHPSPIWRCTQNSLLGRDRRRAPLSGPHSKTTR